MDEMNKNLVQLKSCEKFTALVVCGYVLTFGLVTVGSIIIELITFGIPLLTWITDGVILKAAAGAAGILGVYKSRSTDLYAPAAPIIAGLDLMAFRNVLNMGLLIMALILMIVTLRINRKMSWLEQQPGYPYFSERVIEQERERIQRGIKDQYQQFLENTVKNSRGDMEELAKPDGSMAAAREKLTGGAMEDVVFPPQETADDSEE